MSNSKERRFYERISIPGAEVSYRQKKRFNWFNGYMGPVPMKDITKSGICFRLEAPLERGATVEIKVHIPGVDQFSVHGDIVWADTGAVKEALYAGVQFKPFGKGRRYNSFSTHERLEHISHQFKNPD